MFRCAGPLGLVATLLLGAGCDGGPAVGKDRGADMPEGFAADPAQCGGLVHGDGTLPGGLAFAATKVDVTVNELSRIDLAIFDVATQASLTFAIPVSPASGAPMGPLTVPGQVAPPLTAVDVGLDVQTIESPWAFAAKPWGRIQSTFTASGAGWAISGSFDSAFCNVVATS